jgi:hypothetical protein
MAVPTLVEEAISGANTAADTNLPLTFASIPADDDLIILEYSQSDPTPATRTWPTGFTEFLSYSAGSGADIHCAWKLASGEGSATYDIDLGDAGDANQNLRGQVWTGVDQTTPINVVGTGKDIDFVNEAESFTVNGVTTTVNDCALVIVTADEGNDCTGITSTGFTQLEHDGTPDSNRFLQIMHGSKAAAGATGDITCQAQFGFLSDASTAMFAIAPPTVADPPGASTGPGIVIGSSSSFIGEGAIGAPDSSGTTTPQSLNVTATITPTMLRTVNKLVNVTASTTRTIVRTVAKAITVTGALTPAIVKSVNKPFAVTATLTATLGNGDRYGHDGAPGRQAGQCDGDGYADDRSLDCSRHRGNGDPGANNAPTDGKGDRRNFFPNPDYGSPGRKAAGRHELDDVDYSAHDEQSDRRNIDAHRDPDSDVRSGARRHDLSASAQRDLNAIGVYVASRHLRAHPGGDVDAHADNNPGNVENRRYSGHAGGHAA